MLRRHHFITRASKWRMSQVKEGISNATGPLHDLHDFHFIDGTAPPETNTQRIWKLKRSSEQERIKKLEQEMIDLHLKWQAIDAEKEQQRELKKSLE